MAVSKVFREANFEADGVANWALAQDIGVHVLSVPPVPLRGCLQADRAGVTFSRAVPHSFPL